MLGATNSEGEFVVHDTSSDMPNVGLRDPAVLTWLLRQLHPSGLVMTSSTLPAALSLLPPTAAFGNVVRTLLSFSANPTGSGDSSSACSDKNVAEKFENVTIVIYCTWMASSLKGYNFGRCGLLCVVFWNSTW